MSDPQIYPAAREAARRHLGRIQVAIEQLDAEADAAAEAGDAERQGFKLRAAVGARAFAAHLQHQLDLGLVNDRTAGQSELVASTAELGGWIGTGLEGQRQAQRDLCAAGYLVLHAADPGRYVACYRLVAP